MNGKDLIDSLMYDLDKFQNLTTDTDYRTMALDWINRIIDDIAAKQDQFHWRFLEATKTFSTVADQMSYDLPDDIDGYKILSLRDKTNDRKYTFIDQDDLDKNVPDPSESTGSPYLYTLWANALKLWPIPSSVFTAYLRYIKTMTTLQDNTTVTSEIPDKWKNVVLSGAKELAYTFDKRFTEASLMAVKYANGVNDMKIDNEMIIDRLITAKSHRRTKGRGRRGFVSPAGQ